MTRSDQKPDPRNGDAVRQEAGAVSRETGQVRERVRVLKLGERSGRANKSQALPGTGGTRQSTTDAAAASVFVIARKGADFLDTPVYHAGVSGQEEAVALFTDRPQAQLYLERAGWAQTDEVGELSPADLLRWLAEANGEGVGYAVVNPDRERHLAGDPQAVLCLNALGDKSPNDLFHEVTDLARR